MTSAMVSIVRDTTGIYMASYININMEVLKTWWYCSLP